LQLQADALQFGQGSRIVREIIFDTETTGLDPAADRIIEFGAVELVNRFPTGRTYHLFINPQGRAIHPEAQAVHGISSADLADKPAFPEISSGLVEFLEGAMLVAHNANFDVGFLNAEFGRLGLPPVEPRRIVDTLAIARRKHPMGPNSLDALCRRYGIDNSHRTKHGALLDSELLAEVYIELMGGKQAALVLETANAVERSETTVEVIAAVAARPRPLSPRLSAGERAAHDEMVAAIGDKAIWLRYREAARAAG
jgi:DNA polymerase III subunit epsilon